MKNNILKILKERGMSQLELSRRTKISPADINQIIHGKKFSFPGWRMKISVALCMKEQEIFEDGVEE